MAEKSDTPKQDDAAAAPNEDAVAKTPAEETPKAEAKGAESKDSESKDAEPKAAESKGAEPTAGAKGKGEESKGETKGAAAVEPAPKEEKKDDDRPKTAADIFAELDPDEGGAPKILKAKGSKNIHAGIVHVYATFNNTMVSVSDMNGNVLGWSSAGKMGFRGSRKSTAYAAQLVSQDACRQAMSHGLKTAEVRVKGPGVGRESAVRAVQGLGVDVTLITDVTPIPHNGCRPPKARRV